MTFDISDDRVRYRAVKVLKGYGYRVQKSVFECPHLTEDRFLRLKKRLEALIDMTTDSVRYYAQCGSCLRKVGISGYGIEPKDEEFGMA
ncbi:MAG: CRISPR-associated endonuclease Cas2 [Candidatus Methanomethylicaceae archaeon]